MFCIHCGKELPGQSNYCPFCGKKNYREKTEMDSVLGKTNEQSAIYRPILSNKDQFPISIIALSVVFGVIILICGIFLLGLGFSILETTRWTRGIDQLLPYLFILAGIAAIISSLALGGLVWSMKKSFLTLYPDEVIGATFSPKPTKTALGLAYEAPRQFTIPYSDIIRVEILGRCILLVTSTGTYRCRAHGMEDEFYHELTKRVISCRRTTMIDG